MTRSAGPSQQRDIATKRRVSSEESSLFTRILAKMPHCRTISISSSVAAGITTSSAFVAETHCAPMVDRDVPASVVAAAGNAVQTSDER